MQEQIKEIVKSKWFRRVVIVLSVLVIALLIFQLGQFVGFRRAQFSSRYGEMYYRDGFFDRRPGPIDEFHGKNFLMGNGITGRIIQISTSSLVVMGPDNLEKIISFTPQTPIHAFRGTILISELKINDVIVVIGTPDETGQINAKLIRILPPPSSMRLFRNE